MWRDEGQEGRGTISINLLVATDAVWLDEYGFIREGISRAGMVGRRSAMTREEENTCRLKLCG